ncbi:MAG: hypothetical protein R2718_04405 [Solirubrobacterales bacterium]
MPPARPIASRIRGRRPVCATSASTLAGGRPPLLVLGPAPVRRNRERVLGIRELHGGLVEELLFSELEDVAVAPSHLSDLGAVSVASAIY